MHTEKGILVSPVYDLINVNLVFPEDAEDLALTLGGRKRKIKKTDFDQFANSLNIVEKVRDNIYIEFQKHAESVDKMIDISFLNNDKIEANTAI